MFFVKRIIRAGPQITEFLQIDVGRDTFIGVWAKIVVLTIHTYFMIKFL